MDASEKALARKLFQNKIYKADGQAFEDIFSEIMNYAEHDFQQIKPWGNIGDRKNDGYIKSKGIFFQVFAPEEIEKSYTDAIKKLETDFLGLKSHWSPIYEFYFVVNDKYNGVHADCEKTIQRIKKDHELRDAAFLTAKDLENRLFPLTDDQIINVVGNPPDPANIKQLDYSILGEVVSYIMKLPLPKDNKNGMVLPDWDKKIEFNNLSQQEARYLSSGYAQVSDLNEYLKNNGDFLADSLRDKMNEIYLQEKESKNGDDLFWAIVNCASPKAERVYQTQVIVIMSKYFETCDIFEEPVQKESV